jgi:hypothetical protein
VARHDHHRVGIDERRAAGQELEQHDPDRVQVGAVIERLARGLLGRHVAGRAEDRAVERLELIDLALASDRLGDAEVEY